MPTRRYPLQDGRQVEINDAVFSGRAYVYVDGHYLGKNTIHELRQSQEFTLPDGGRLLIHVVNWIPFFRLFDVRHNGVAVRRSASDPRWARRTAIEIWMRHLTNVIEYTPEIREPSPQKMPQVTLG